MAENLYSPKQKVLTNEGKDNFDRIFWGDACGCFPKNVVWKTAEEIKAMYENRYKSESIRLKDNWDEVEWGVGTLEANLEYQEAQRGLNHLRSQSLKALLRREQDKGKVLGHFT